MEAFLFRNASLKHIRLDSIFFFEVSTAFGKYSRNRLAHNHRPPPP